MLGGGCASVNGVRLGDELNPPVFDVAEWLGCGEECLQRRQQLCRRSFVRVVPGVGDLDGHRVRDTFGEVVVVARWDGLSSAAPGDQQRDVFEQTQLAGGADHLSAPVDDRARCPQKRTPLLLVG